MEGKDHALSGALVFAGLAPLTVPLTGPELAVGTILTAGAALLPDFDEPGSTISREGGWLTSGFAHLVHWAAGGHRRGTHTLLGTVIFTATAVLAVTEASNWGGKAWLFLWLALLISAALRVLPLPGRGHLLDTAGTAAAAGMCFWHNGLALVPACVGLGVLAHIAGDELTHGGCPFLWPVFNHKFHLLPKRLQFTTGAAFESVFLSPALTVALTVVVLWDTGGIGWLAVHTSGHLAH